MEYGFTTAAYVVAAVLFIQSLGGLSGQESAKRAVWYGITGMALAMMEAFADYGTVQYFGVPTLTTGIFRTWFGMGQQQGAATTLPRTTGIKEIQQEYVANVPQ